LHLTVFFINQQQSASASVSDTLQSIAVGVCSTTAHLLNYIFDSALRKVFQSRVFSIFSFFISTQNSECSFSHIVWFTVRARVCFFVKRREKINSRNIIFWATFVLLRRPLLVGSFNFVTNFFRATF